ncbi:MAG: NAD-dependent epimerase/dehydratase family protein [Gemmatimonadetes bacterium]|nr:NAD-dependent epimerase/dehydratase family protein [Gemmatimonadota bacterium]
MTPTRRDFIKTTGAVGAGLALGGNLACSSPENESTQSGPEPMSMLILGGTGFIGPHMVRYAVERGHQVSIFTRGRSDADLPDSVERLVGDRNDDHSALEGRTWDVVMDNNCQNYLWAQTSTELLSSATQQYIFVSSISAYLLEGFGWDKWDQVMLEPLVDEDYPRFEPPEGWEFGDDADYGLMKALSENIAHEAFPGRATIVRPGLIVGPEDPTDRFTYWPVRFDEGGEILAPGNPEHANQIIDQRDLTEWIVRLAENRTMGDFNATGPAERLSMGSMLDQIGSVVTDPYELTWVPEPFLQAQEVRPWTDLPSWIPGDPLMFVDVRSAVDAGLTFRPLATTARDTIQWDKTRPAEERENRSFGMSREREREVLDAWHASQG